MTEREYRLAHSRAPRQNSSGLVWALCIFWIVASIVGFAMQAFAATPSGLRGVQTDAPAPTIAAIPKMRRGQSVRATPATPQTPQAWLGSSVWRAGPCDSAQNFQAFSFTAEPKVEVGAGKVGEGERLQLLAVTADPQGMIQVETRVCAPVGCNQTIERYKKLGPNQMQEWHFEGRLPDHVPYVIVQDGAALDGSGPGRVFNRCGG
jgi:hypothetical protein